MTTTDFTASWNKSIQVRKQRKYRYNAPLHHRQKMVHVHLSPELRKKYGIRNTQVKKGDKIKVLKGQFKKKEGKVERVILKRERVFVAGIELIKKEGTKVPVALTPSNLMITELNLDDRRRKQKLESKHNHSAEKSKKQQPEKENKIEMKKTEIKKK